MGDRALEPGFWGGYPRAPKKTSHKISTADGGIREEAGPESPGEQCIGTKQAGARVPEASTEDGFYRQTRTPS